MELIRFRMRLCPRRAGEITSLPKPSSWILGVLFLKKAKKKGREIGRKGERREEINEEKKFERRKNMEMKKDQPASPTDIFGYATDNDNGLRSAGCQTDSVAITITPLHQTSLCAKCCVCSVAFLLYISSLYYKAGSSSTRQADARRASFMNVCNIASTTAHEASVFIPLDEFLQYKTS